MSHNISKSCFSERIHKSGIWLWFYYSSHHWSEVEGNHDVEGGIFRETRLVSVVSKMFALSEHHVRVASVPLFFLWLCFLPELSCGVVRYFFWMYWPCLSCSRLCGLQSLVLGLSQRSVNYPKSKCWNPNLQCDSLRRWGPWEVIRS